MKRRKPATGWKVHYIGDGLYQVVLFLNGQPIEYAVKSDAAGRGPWTKTVAESVRAELVEQLKRGVRLEQKN
jgi:hypothetical protein